jgi:hypothetical protein
MEAVAGADAAGETPQAADGMQPTADGQKPTPGSKTEQKTDGQGPASTPEQAPGFGERGRMRRRARFLRKARELAYRDLGGLVFDLHRFGQRNDPLVLAKLAALRQIDTEVRELEAVLNERRPVTVLREVGIAACPRCAAIHGSDDRFCPGCGLAFDAKADRPISTAPVNRQVQTPAPAATAATTFVSAAGTAPASGPVSAPVATPASQQAPVSPRLAPAAKPTAAPAAAKPTVPTTPDEKGPDRTGEDEPTQILRPPASGR